MNIVRYNDPIETMRDMNRLFERVLQPREGDNSQVETSHWLPSVDIREKDNQYELKADLPGVDPENVQVYMDDDALVIKGERQEEHKEEQQGGSRIERLQGTFYRRFTLPETADSDNIDAEIQQGVLTVTIPKKQPSSQQRQIKVKNKG